MSAWLHPSVWVISACIEMLLLVNLNRHGGRRSAATIFIALLLAACAFMAGFSVAAAGA